MQPNRTNRLRQRADLPQQTPWRRVKLTTDFEGGTAMAKTMAWRSNGWTTIGEAYVIYDPWGDDPDRGWSYLVTDDECKVHYSRHAKRWEVFDAPCPEE